jgi:Transcriptional regulators
VLIKKKLYNIIWLIFILLIYKFIKGGYMSVRVKDIAELLGISPSTVSLVLNNKPGISQKTRQRVFDAISEMGYDTNFLSKPALNNNKSIRLIVYKKHGKVVSDTPFFAELLEAIESEARKNGYNLVFSYVNENENKVDVLRIIKEHPLDGVLVLATEMSNEEISAFSKIDSPVLVLDNYFQSEKLDTVVINNVQGAYEAVNYLISCGHKKIGYLHSSIRINNFSERYDGYIKALGDNGFKAENDYIWELESTLDGAYRDARELLAKNKNLPTAFFADNDIIALGAMKAFREAGYAIPEDISIIGFDDMPFCEMAEPSLTTIKVFKQAMGRHAVKRLIENIEVKSSGYIKIEIGTELVKRKSVKKLDT